jgi:hypothetical protein
VNQNYSWRRDKTSPFAFFLRIIDSYCHPESGMTVDDLREWVRYPEQTDEMILFKDEFRRLLSGEIDQLPKGALGTASAFDDDSEEAYLRRLWHELYGDEPVQPGKPVA